jgi:hypothetical protein
VKGQRQQKGRLETKELIDVHLEINADDLEKQSFGDGLVAMIRDCRPAAIGMSKSDVGSFLPNGLKAKLLDPLD